MLSIRNSIPKPVIYTYFSNCVKCLDDNNIKVPSQRIQNASNIDPKSNAL